MQEIIFPSEHCCFVIMAPLFYCVDRRGVECCFVEGVGGRSIAPMLYGDRMGLGWVGRPPFYRGHRIHGPPQKELEVSELDRSFA